VIPAVNAKAAANIHKVFAKAVLEFYSGAGRRTKKLLTAEHAENDREIAEKINAALFSLTDFLCVLLLFSAL
jgi:phospholipid N-methyltransferase